MQFLKEYRKVKDVFVKPKIKFYFTRNKHKPWIWLTNKFGWTPKYKCYYPKDEVLVFDGYAEEFRGIPVKKYSSSKHKLPKGVSIYEPVWNRNIRKKWWSFIPPVIKLPSWMNFKFTNRDIIWKTKWDDYRYEFPAIISLTLFGFEFGIMSSDDDDYWESLLTWDTCKDVKELDGIMGKWHLLNSDTYENRVKPEFFKEPYRTNLIKFRETSEQF